MITKNPLIYELINIHNQKFDVKKLFLSKKFRKRDSKIIKKVLAPFILFMGIISIVLVFLIKDKNYNILGIIFALTILIFAFSYKYFYFNRFAKKDTKYKPQGNKFLDFFKPWLTIEQQNEQLKKIKAHYSENQLQSLIDTAKNEYDFQKGKNSLVHFEAISISLLAIILTMLIELSLIKDWLININNGKKLSFEDNLYVFKTVIGLILLILLTYNYLKWNINLGYRDKKKKLKNFIQSLILAKGTEY